MIELITEIFKTFCQTLISVGGFFGNLIHNNNYIIIGAIFALCALAGCFFGKITKPSHKR